jgi:hypothetical protein
MGKATQSSYAMGYFELAVDGHDTTAYVKSVEGGWTHAETTAKSPRVRQMITSVDVKPITVELGMLASTGMLKWIQQSWNASDHQRRNGQITYADFDMKAVFEHEFFNALLTHITFPTLDGSSKDSGYLTCTMQPESVNMKPLQTPGYRLAGTTSPRQKMWTPSAFHFNIDGVRDMQYVNKLDSFTVTLDIKKLRMGSFRLPEIVPTGLKFPNLKGTVSLRYADALIQWHEDYIRSQDGAGTPDDKALKTGSIEFLSADRKKTLFRIRLIDVGMVRLDFVKSLANDPQIKRLEFELCVRKMEIEGSTALGFA